MRPEQYFVNGLQIDSKRFPTLGHWNRNYTMETLLAELRREMSAPHNRKVQQPAEGTMY